MTSSDVRDMLNLPTDGHPRPVKKQKTVEKRPEGITRELFALLGENAPPVAINDHVKYKDRPKRSHRVQPWELTAFRPGSRADGLVLRHWRRRDASEPIPKSPAAVTEDTATKEQSQPAVDERFAKYNVKVRGPEYNDEQYNTHLRSDDWSKEETDYLVNLCLDYDLRWTIIADRYDFQATTKAEDDEVSTALVPTPKQRVCEDMKARYYEVAAKMLAVIRPPSNMSTAEFDLYERMTKFNPVLETQRKKLAEGLMARSPDEIKEEEVLLGELRRIISNQERLSEEQKELRDRLESPQSSGNITMYQSSTGLAQLMQTLLQVDKTKKRRSLLGPGEGGVSPSVGPSGQGHSTPAGHDAKDSGHRDSIGGGTGANKKGAVASVAERKKLTPQEEAKYGVTHHDRLTSGVQFRHDRISKLGQAKSNVQATKIGQALSELQIPPRLHMPTASVCAEYERLIQAIHTLLDVRKVSEKVESEIKVALAQKEEREKKERAARGEPELDSGSAQEEADKSKPEVEAADSSADAEGEVAGEEVKEEVEEANGAEPEDDDEISEAVPSSGGGHKRSASVMSAISDKSSKRQRR